MKEALEKLADAFSDFTDTLRDMAMDAPEANKAGAGEEPDDGKIVPIARAPEGRGGFGDDVVVQIRSGDLRQVVNAYRKLSRMAREGQIPTQDERFELHQHIKKVKHLIRKPIHDRLH